MGPKEKKERALGEHLHLKAERCNSPKCAMVKKPYKPGQHGPRGRRSNLSEFGLQLREKQKFKLTYGVDDRNLAEIYRRAAKAKGSTSMKLMELLERRLDNVVYRMGITKSRGAARSLILHGHIYVDKKRVRSPGYVVRAGETVIVRTESRVKGAFKNLKEYLKSYQTPDWLVFDESKMEGKVKALPAELTPPFEINLLVESFSK